MTATALAAVGSNANENGTLLISGTAVTASGTSVDFTGIPSWVKRVTVMFSGVSTNGTSNLLVQIGSGSFTTSGYLGSGTFATASVGSANNSTGFRTDNFAGATNVRHAKYELCLITGNTWVFSGLTAISDAAGTSLAAGSLALSGTLDRVRVTTVNGTDTFDAGTINIMWE